VRRAAQLAAQHGAELHVVHAYESVSVRVLTRLGLQPDAAAVIEAAARKRLEHLALSLRHGGVRVTTHLAKGGPLAALEDVAKRSGTGLVIVGARGERSLRNTALGSTAERVLERLPWDVLAVRRPSSHPHARMLVCLDGGRDSAAVLTAAERLCPGARTWALHAFDAHYEGMLRTAGAAEKTIRQHVRASSAEANARMSDLLRRAKLGPREVRVVVRRGHPVRVITEMIERYNIDLVVLGRARTMIAQLLLGSVSKEVLRRAACDVAVVGRANKSLQ
jgi:nucleotide-binding universal stress UspA family protein